MRRIGELMEAQKESVGLNKGGRPKEKTGSATDPVSDTPKPPTLAEAGIDKHLADKARKAARLPREDFERKVDQKVINIRSRKAKSVQARAPVKRSPKQGVRTEDFRSAVRGLTKGLSQITDKFSSGRHLRLTKSYLADHSTLDATDSAIIGQLRGEIERFSNVIATLDALLPREQIVTTMEDLAPEAEASPETMH